MRETLGDPGEWEVRKSPVEREMGLINAPLGSVSRDFQALIAFSVSPCHHPGSLFFSFLSYRLLDFGMILYNELMLPRACFFLVKNISFAPSLQVS